MTDDTDEPRAASLGAGNVIRTTRRVINKVVDAVNSSLYHSYRLILHILLDLLYYHCLLVVSVGSRRTSSRCSNTHITRTCNLPTVSVVHTYRFAIAVLGAHNC